MKATANLFDDVLNAWKINNRVNIYLIENLPEEVWTKNVPGYKRKTVQMIGGHLHNTRCMWIEASGKKYEIDEPSPVDRYSVTRKDLINALEISSDAILRMLHKGMEQGGNISGFSLGAVHFQNYLVAHEAHHRGQMIMAARQLGHRLPQEVTYGVWKWSVISKETG